MPELQHTVVVHITDNNDVFIFDISASVSFQPVEIWSLLWFLPLPFIYIYLSLLFL